jgi:hypothetical protein
VKLHVHVNALAYQISQKHNWSKKPNANQYGIHEVRRLVRHVVVVVA